MSILSVVNSQIRLETTAIAEANFGIPLVIGPHTVFSGRVRSYTTTDALLQDGFSSEDPIFKAVQAVYSALGRVERVLVGRRQVDNLTVTVATVADNTDYSITLNGTVYSINSGVSATVSSIETALASAMNAGSDPQTATASGGSGVALANDVPGAVFTLSASANLAVALPMSSDNVTNDLTAINQEAEGLGGWYGLLMAERDQDDVLEAAAWIEAAYPKRIFGTATDDVACTDPASTTDLMSLLKASDYFRTYCYYHKDAKNGEYPEATSMGESFSRQPGSATWAFKRLPGIPISDLSDTAFNAIRKNYGFGKNGNVLVRIKGVPMTYEGTMASGEYIDNVRFMDWLNEQITVNVFSLLVNSPKVPYTDGGIEAIGQRIETALKAGIRAGGISPAYEDPESGELIQSYWIKLPKQAEIPFNNKANRILKKPYAPEWRAVLAGAIHAVEIEGTLTVGNI